MPISDTAKRIISIAHRSDDAAKRIIREVWEEDPFAAKRLMKLLAEIGEEDVSVRNP